MTQLALNFDLPYPTMAGWKDNDTSREAAETIDAGMLRVKVWACLHRHGSMTADECAELLGMSILSIRPRFSELRNLGKIEDTGARRRNHSGKNAKVWTISRTASADTETNEKTPAAQCGRGN
jgi:predicted ArsR family transcriptional regulator